MPTERERAASDPPPMTEREIMKKLAAMNPKADGPYWPTVCYFCDAELDRDADRDSDDVNEYTPGCLWRAAKRIAVSE